MNRRRLIPLAVLAVAVAGCGAGAHHATSTPESGPTAPVTGTIHKAEREHEVGRDLQAAERERRTAAGQGRADRAQEMERLERIMLIASIHTMADVLRELDKDGRLNRVSLEALEDDLMPNGRGAITVAHFAPGELGPDRLPHWGWSPE